jgi:uncharacterized repeat protein (TIGR01451 family)
MNREQIAQPRVDWAGTNFSTMNISIDRLLWRWSLSARALLCCAALAGTAAAAVAAPASADAKTLHYAAGWNQSQSHPVLAGFNSWANEYTVATNLAARAQMQSQGLSLARERRAMLAELIKSNPQQALAAAVPASVRGQLPPDIAAELETRVSGIGDFSVLGVLPAIDGPPVRPIERFVHLDGRTYRAYVYGRRASQTSKWGIPLSGIAVGDVLALHEGAIREFDPGETVPPGKPVIDLRNQGQRPLAGLTPKLAEVGGKVYHFASSEELQQAEIRLEKAEGGLNPTPAQSAADVLAQGGQSSTPGSGPGADPPTAWTTGPKNVLVIRVDFTDLPGDPETAAFCQNLMDTQNSPYYAKSSYGLTSLSNTVTTQLYRMPQTAATYATGGLNTELHADAEAAASADYPVHSFDRIIVFFAWLGNIPGSQITYGGLAEAPGTNVWVNGEFDFRILSHELGHTYGLWHAALWLVTDGNPISPTGTAVEYGDDFDTMGANFANDQNTDFSERNKNILGWLPDSKVLPITTNGVYRIYAFDWANYVAATNAPVLALTMVKDSDRTYWIGVRRNFTSNPTMEHGAYVIWGLSSIGAGGGGGYSSELLDLNTPGTAPAPGVNSDYDAALTIGQTFVDPAIGLTMKPIAEGGTWPNSYLDIQIGGTSGGGVDLEVVTNYVSGGNGDGIIEFNECNNLSLVLTNLGFKNATGISATLFTTTPGAAIAQPASPYPNIPSTGSGVNTVPFQISTSPSFVCGTPIACSLYLQFDQGFSIYKFTLPSGVPGSPARFDSSAVVPIPSPGSAKSTIVVSNVTDALNKVTLSLFVTEDFDSALSLELVGPDGTSCILSTNNGGFDQDYGLACSPDSQRTTFDDAALTPISSGLAPFLGAFRPAQPLSIFIGKSGTNVNGVWQLRAADQGQLDTAAIQCWSLLLTPTLCIDGGGQCPGADMAVAMDAQPDPVVAGNNLTYTISVTNLGPSSASNVVVTHLIPNTVTFVSAAASQGTYSQQGGVTTFSLGPMGPREVATLTVIGLPTVTGQIFSTATVASEQQDPNTLNNTVTVQTQVNPSTADLAVGLAAAPSPVLIGSTLTYTVSLTNNGPNPATVITVTNILPASAPILSATFSRGTATYAGNVIFWRLDSLARAATATAIITVTPTVEGLITATAAVAAREVDPIQANNTASVTTTVGPAADLAISIADFPDPAVAGSNVTYTVSVTNQGPSTATGVIVNDSLPAAVTVVSTNATQGTVSIAGRTLTWSLGTMSSGTRATLTVVVHTTTNATLTTSATVAGAQADPNLANNSATATTQVAPPGVALAAAGATLTAESFSPPNGAIDIGETVTVVLRLRNVSNVNTLNLVGALLTTNGVTPVAPNTPQSYGVVAPSGFPVGRAFSFTASGTNGQTIYPTLQLQDGTNSYPPVSFAFTLPKTQVFANTNVILIPDPAAPNPPYPVASGPAKPYPSAITVSSFSGVLGKVTVTLANFNHTYPGDVNVLLVAPSGAKALIMSHAGDQPVTGLNLTFDDSATGVLPAAGQLFSGVWQPTAYSPAPGLGGFPSNAPAGPYSSTLSAFNGVNPIGPWSLYVFDDAGGDSGAISNGWSLTLTSVTPVNQLADLGLSAVAAPSPCPAGGTLTYTFTITNAGPNAATSVAFTNVLPAGVTNVSSGASQGSVFTTPTSVIVNLGTLNAGAIATITNSMTVTAAAIPQGLTSATLTSVANVAANETDLNPANSSVSVVTTVTAISDLGLTQTVAPDPVFVGYNLTSTVLITNRGPCTALSVVLTNSFLPASVSLVSVSLSQGTWSPGATNIVASLGTLSNGAVASMTVVLTRSVPGSLTNTVSLGTSTSDPITNNNSATRVVTVISAAPQIVNAGRALVFESGPVNGLIDPEETVTLSLALANVGSLDTVNLVATLLATNGVTTNQTVSGHPAVLTNSYGSLIHGGLAATNRFTFKAASVLSSTTVAILQLRDERQGVTNNLGQVAFVFSSPPMNAAPIAIPDHGTGVPYPSTISISGLTGQVAKATVTLHGFTHSFPQDLNILLVHPSGGNVLLMSHAGAGYAVTNPITLTFDDAAPNTLPDNGLLMTKTYQPGSYPETVAFPAPAPSGPYGSTLGAINGLDPNVTWSLYVLDDAPGDAGLIAGGWSLTLATVVNVAPARLSGSVTNNGFHLILTAQPGFTYAIDSSANLTSWLALSTNTAPPGGTTEFTDTNAPSFNERFYRSRQLTP